MKYFTLVDSRGWVLSAQSLTSRFFDQDPRAPFAMSYTSRPEADDAARRLNLTVKENER